MTITLPEQFNNIYSVSILNKYCNIHEVSILGKQQLSEVDFDYIINNNTMPQVAEKSANAVSFVLA